VCPGRVGILLDTKDQARRLCNTYVASEIRKAIARAPTDVDGQQLTDRVEGDASTDFAAGGGAARTRVFIAVNYRNNASAVIVVRSMAFLRRFIPRSYTERKRPWLIAREAEPKLSLPSKGCGNEAPPCIAISRR